MVHLTLKKVGGTAHGVDGHEHKVIRKIRMLTLGWWLFCGATGCGGGTRLIDKHHTAARGFRDSSLQFFV
jgi:hypothetical protein